MAEVTELTPKTETESDNPTSKQNAKPGRGRPVKGSQRPPEVRQPQFFDSVAAVPQEDWGTRAFMYVYVDEPACNPKTFGESRYLLKSSAPILDLEGLKQDYGSFKGWMSLNLRKTGKDATDEVDRLNFEIYDPKHPPKIPRGSWANDARNKRWLDLLPPEPPPASAAASSLLEGARFYKDIRSELKEEMQPADEPQNSTSEILATMKAAKELFAPAATPATAPPADPFDTAAKIMAMRANDPMTAVMMGLLTAANAATEAAREREFKLQQQLMEAKTSTAPAKDMFTQFIEFATSDKFESVKKVLGFGGEVTGRVARTTAYDVVRDIASSPFGANLGQGLGMLLSNLAQSGAQANGAPSQPRPQLVPNPALNNGTVPPKKTDEQRIQRIGQQITQPMLYEFFLKDATGDVFAERMFDMWPEDYVFMRTLGAENIVNRYRQFAPAWAVIGPKEPDFITFIQEFCKWDPNADEGPAPPDNGDAGTVDLDSEEGA